MTDGIIQQVCHNYNGIIQDYLLDQLQQELIEKIKQLLPLEESITNIHGNYTGMFYRKHIITQLIGDNQE